MAFTGNFMCTSFKKELMFGAHDFAAAGDTFKMALYTSSATLDASTTAYSATNEVSGTGYSAGGQALTSVDPATSGTTAYGDFDDETWSTATITARGALIYNSTPNTTSISLTNPSVVVLDFGSDKTSTAGDFTVVFPTADASTAIIRIA
jgi:formylmethanofuran:tetrahydromethanopterin formyltransferase